jgi:uncharacterized protein (DUF2132 family)
MADEQLNNPLHGITLKALLTGLVEEHGWEYLAERVKIQCFSNEPSIKSSLTFLRKTPWARAKVEGIYLSDFKGRERKRKRNLRRAARRAYAESVKDGTVERMVILSDVELAMTDATPSPVEEVVTEEAGLTATSEMTEESPWTQRQVRSKTSRPKLRQLQQTPSSQRQSTRRRQPTQKKSPTKPKKTCRVGPSAEARE